MSEGAQPIRPDRPQGCDPTKTMQLAWQGQRGDAAAVDELFRRYMQRMLRLIRSRIGPGAQAGLDAEDVLQETMLVALRRLPEVDVHAPSSFYRWLARIAQHKICERLEYLSAEKRDPAREEGRCDSESGVWSVPAPSQEPSPSQSLERCESEQLVDACVDTLEPPDFRAVILLRDYCGEDWESIRVALGRPSLDAVKDLHGRARRRLRERLRTLDDRR